ncbi:hypothetical protein ACWGB8_08635 [Kitasatospora sp. NPDC054939]
MNDRRRKRRRPTGRELLGLALVTLLAAGVATFAAGLVDHSRPGERPLVWWMFFATAFIAGTSRLDRH